MQAKGRKRAVKYEKLVPFLRILTALAVIVVLYQRLRIDTSIVFAVYMLFAASQLVCGDLMRKLISKYKYLAVSFDIVFISCLIMLTGGSTSVYWPLYLAPIISFTVIRGGFSGVVVAFICVVFYFLVIYYSELSLRNIPADFLMSVFLVTLLTTLLFYRDKKAALKKATTDPLTKTYNLGYFQECLDRAID